MARTLIVTLALTVSHLEGDELLDAKEGSPEILDEDEEVIEYPAGDDSDLDETSPNEIAEAVAYAVVDDSEMWAGSGIFAKIEAANVRNAEWVA